MDLDESAYTASQLSTYDSTVFTTPSGHIGGSATLGGAGLPGGVTFLAAAGDNGPYAGDGTTTIAPQYPATSPNVIAVGGTSLTVDGSNPNYTYGGETAWGDGTKSWRDGGGGGGISAYESQPSYQSGVVSAFSTTQRTYPDVSADADPNSGVPVYDSYDDGTSTPWNNYNGGTSLSCPLWAGIIAIADEGRAIAGQGSLDGRTQTLPELYKLPAADFHDITSGSTGSSPTYNAGPGYDLATGIGSPVGNLLIPGLVAYQPTVTGISPATGPAAGGTVRDHHGNGLQRGHDGRFRHDPGNQRDRRIGDRDHGHQPGGVGHGERNGDGPRRHLGDLVRRPVHLRAAGGDAVSALLRDTTAADGDPDR